MFEKLTALAEACNKHFKELYKRIDDLKKANYTAQDAEYWRGRERLYVQSRGHGLVTNGSGLLGDNTNFSKFTFDPTDAAVGSGCFVSNVQNADWTIDEFIPVTPTTTYQVDFYAKYHKTSGNNGKAYFYTVAFDADQHPMNPIHWCECTFNCESTDLNGGRITVAPEDRERVDSYYQRYRNSSVPSWFLNPQYTSRSGFPYKFGTYSRDSRTARISTNKIQYDKTTGNLTGLGQISGGHLHQYSWAFAGGSYAYNCVDLIDSELDSDWKHYTTKFSMQQMDFRVPASIHNNLGRMAHYIKLGFLMNRGVTGSVTAISGLQISKA